MKLHEKQIFKTERVDTERSFDKYVRSYSDFFLEYNFFKEVIEVG
jgi:hypothetical protein